MIPGGNLVSLALAALGLPYRREGSTSHAPALQEPVKVTPEPFEGAGSAEDGSRYRGHVEADALGQQQGHHRRAPVRRELHGGTSPIGRAR